MSETLVSIFRNNKCSERGITFISARDKEDFISYQELYEKASLLLEILKEKGLGERDEVIIQIEDSKAFLISFWACLLGKMIAVPIATGNQHDHRLKLFHIWNSLNSPFLISDDEQLQRLGKYAVENNLKEEYKKISEHFLAFPNNIIESRAPEKNLPLQEINILADDIAYIQFSSGSTGQPKGVILTHRNLVTNTKDIADRSEITDSDSMLSWMPLTHDMGLICFHLTGIISGVNQYIIPTALFIRRPLLWLEKASEHHVSLLYSPNFGIQYFLWAYENSPIDLNLSCVRLIYNGAEPISASLCHRFINELSSKGLGSNTIFPGYGLAEASVAVTLPFIGKEIIEYNVLRNSLNIGDRVIPSDKNEEGVVTFVEVGCPINNCKVRICDDSGNVLGDNFIGHIQIKGDNVTQGYYNNPDATDTLFTHDSWLKTGDLGFLSNGRLVITGRYKNLIIVNGQNYYPQDIEKAICDGVGLELGKVVACGVRNHAQSEEELVIFVLHKRPSADFVKIIESIKQLVLNVIGITVELVVPVNKIPKTTSGKIRHFKLIEQYTKGEFNPSLQKLKEIHQKVQSHSYDNEDGGGSTQLLLNILRELTGNPKIEQNESFFKLGMNSILATQFASRVHHKCAVRLSVSDIYNHPTALQLSEFLQDLSPGTQLEVRPIERSDSYALSFAQKRFWVLDQMKPGNSAYNVPVCYALKGTLDIPKLEKTFQILVAQYEVLRTAFLVSDGIPHQKIAENINFKIVCHDLSEEDSCADRARKMAMAASHISFDLSTAPLFRVYLYKLDQEDFLLLLNFHHIITDGWSINMLLKEVGEIYQRLSANQKFSKKELLWQYKDFAAWQLDLVESGCFDEHRSYWLQELRGELVAPELSLGKPAVSSEDKTPSIAQFMLSENTLKKLRKLASSQESTLFMVLLALVKILFYKYTGQKDLVVGTDTSGRGAVDFESQPGYFLNTVCIRTFLDPQRSFDSILQQVKEKVLLAFKYQDYPFDLLLEDLGQTRGLGTTPLFNTLVLLQNLDTSGLEGAIEGVTARHLDIIQDLNLVDLQFEFEETPGGLSLILRYNNGIFSASQIEAFFGHFKKLTEEILTYPSKCIFEYEILSESEQKLLNAFNDTNCDYNEEGPVHKLIEKQAEWTPSQIALIYNDNEVTYEELNAKANQLAFYLKSKCNIGQDKPVSIGLMLKKSEHLIITILAILKSGASYIPIDPDYPAARCRHIIKDTGLEIIVVDKHTHGICKDIGQFVSLLQVDEEAVIEEINQQPTRNLEHRVKPEDLAYIIYTSATTGAPKGVMIKHEAVLDYTLTFKDYFSINSNDTVVQQSSIGFDTLVEEVFPILAAGGKLIIPNNDGRDIDDLLYHIDKYNVTILSTTPLIINEINGRPWKFSSLRIIISGGDLLRPAYIDNLINKVDLYNTYGPAEATVCATFHKIESLKDSHFIGKPIANHKIHILDDDGKRLVVGAPGEICISGCGLAAGYLNMEKLTRQKFAANQDEIIYHTGDLGRWTPDGKIEFLGRKDLQVKIRGYRIEPEEIEKVLCQHPKIRDAAVIADIDQNSLTAFVVGEMDQKESLLRRHMASFLPTYMLPHRFVMLSELPKTVHGKVDRSSLASVSKSEVNTGNHVPPTGELELTIAKIWKDVLGVSEIGVHNNFFDLGGNSIKAIQIISRLQKEQNVKIEVRDLFINPTLAKLSEVIEQSTQSFYECIQPTAKRDYYDVSNAQRRIWILEQLDQSSLAYNEFEIYELEGDLSVSFLDQSLKSVIRKHEILRTTFIDINGEPKQVVHPEEDNRFELIYEDLRSENDPDAIVRASVSEEVSTPIDLKNGPLLRAKVYQTTDDNYIFLIVIHHIISDGWSGQILVRELLDVYNCLFAGKALPHTEPGIQYKDYVYWKNEHIHSGALEPHRRYWQNCFKDDIPVIDLPLDFRRPKLKAYRGNTLSFSFDAGFLKRANRFGKKYNASKFMIFLAALKVLLYRYTAQNDIIIGTPVAGREHADLEQQLGLYINLLPLRSQIDGKKSFESFLNQIKEMTLEAYEHQSYPFDLLVDELDIARDINRSPLFDILIAYQHKEISFERQHIGGLHVTKLEKDISISKYDLSFYFEEYQDEITLGIEYDGELFLKPTIEKFFTHYTTLVQSVFNDPVQEIDTINFLSAQEHDTLLKYFNNTDVEYAKDVAVHQMFENQALQNPEAVAITFNARSFSYKEINERANQRAAFLHSECKLKPNELVGLLLDRSEEMIISILAIWKAGAAYVPIDPQYPKERIIYLLEDTKLSTVLTNGKYLSLNRWLQWEVESYKNLITIDQPEINYSGFNDQSKHLWNHVTNTADNEAESCGWINSYTKKAFDKEDLQELWNNVINKVRPHLHAESKVLEVGCGSGAIMYELAPLVKKYTATDISDVVVNNSRVQFQEKGLHNIDVKQLAANEIDFLKEQKFDIIIANSVVQYFPDAGYLLDFLNKAIDLLDEHGIIFLGDLRDKELQLQYYRSLFDESADLEHEILRKKKLEEELFVSKHFLIDLVKGLSCYGEVEFSEKQGKIENELKKYRFDSVIRVDRTKSGSAVKPDKNHILARTEQNFKCTNLNIPAGDRAYIIYTSGSTGKPKGVDIMHRSVVNFLLSMKKKPGMVSSDKLLAVTTYTFDISVLEFFLPLITGGQVLLAGESDAKDPSTLIRMIRTEQPTIMQATPSTWNMMFANGWTGSKTLKVLSGGERLPEELALKLLKSSGEVWNMYGPTETTIWSTTGKVRLGYGSNVGSPIDNTTVYVLSERQQLLPIGAFGNLYIGGEGLASQYLNQPHLSKEKFIRSPFDSDKRLYYTGDIARWCSDGTLELFGRSDDQVKVNGYRIELGEIENTLLTYKSIKEVAVIAKDDPEGSKFLVAFVCGSEFDTAALREYLVERLPLYMVPSFYEVLEEIPHTPNGKINRKALQEFRLSVSSSSVDHIAPESELERKLAMIWKLVLNIDTVGVEDNFFQMGGHSLKAIRLVSGIEQELQYKLNLREVFINPTIRQLARIMSVGVKTKSVELAPIEIKDYYDVTPSQKRFWLLNQLDERVAYNLPGAHRIKGELDAEALDKAFEKLIQRHESLRTSFIQVNGELKQKINNTSDFRVEYIDLSDRDEKLAETQKIADEETFMPFDLSSGKLIRAKLIRLADNDHVFLFTIHHIISDAWSINVLIKEVLMVYESCINSDDIALPPLPVQYKDYSHWVNLQVKSQENAKYWQGQFREGVPVLELPLDYPRPAIKSNAGDRAYFSVPKDLKDALKTLAKNHQASLYMGLIAGQVLLYHKYSNQNSIVIGAPLADRDHKYLNDQIGYYVNNIPLHISFNEKCTFIDLLETARKVVLGAYDHKSYPLEQLLEDLDIQRDLSRSVLYDVGFTWDGNYHDHFKGLKSLQIEEFHLEYKLAQTDLWFYGVEHPDRLDFIVEYNTDIFTARKINQLINHYLNILSEVVRQPESALPEINYLSGPERERILSSFNATICNNEYNRTIVEIFEHYAAIQPDSLALVYGDVSWSYGELNASANRLAHHLRNEMGVKPNDLVGIMLPRSEWVVLSILGILKAGGAYVPVDPNLPKERMQYIFEDTGLKTILLNTDYFFNLDFFTGNLIAIDIQF
ncbi:non-ribosomal peptide synthetase, partial [Fulvivirga imtechensis]|uniref:non-ribosomal peptide synthetase n=1 Tax=Fulvivirga imtechensis TaxID=881893 RepID=UPI00058D28D9